MNNESNDIYDFPLDKFKHNLPFSGDTSSEFFYANAFHAYSSLDDFLSYNRIKNCDDNTTAFDFFYIENNKSYYQELDDKKYTFKNIPYSLFISTVIKHELTHPSKVSTSFSSDFYNRYKWSIIWTYLMFTTFPVRQILEEGQFMKSEKENILSGFYQGFSTNIEPSQLKSFFSKKDCKERLLYILLYAEIPRIKSTALVEKAFLTQDLSDITSYFGEILHNYKVDLLKAKFF